MDMFVIEGGAPLRGRVAVGGAKNAALPVMAAALLADGPVRLHGVPQLVDVATMTRLLQSLGVRVHRRDGAGPKLSPLTLDVVDSAPHVADYDLVRRMRAGVCVLGPLLAKRGRAVVSLPGGCNIGDRPIDLHLKGLRALGADVRIERGYVIAEARRLRGADIELGGPSGSSVTGTCNVMSAAALAEGRTVIESAAGEPEVVDLGEFLNRMGAKIAGLGTSRLTIEGVERLRGTDHTVIPDRIEAATLMIAAAMTQGDVVVESLRRDHVAAVTEVLRQMGARCDEHGGGIRVTASARPRPVRIVAEPHPGIPTDVQAQLMALCCVADGDSVVTDRVFPDRFMHAAELNRMGARIRRDGPSAIVSGVRRLSGARVMASDLRASAALVLAGLAAEGTTAVKRIYHLDRGYERLERKFAALGASVRRVDDPFEDRPARFIPSESVEGRAA
ncbi:MAG: UDP-N-acetylglucosamine 1-carboxyvinyltransferase [Planctomycetaceae bacterium]